MKHASILSPARGFTLLELLVVIAIIGTLAGLMYPAVTGALQKAQNTHALQTATSLKTAISAYNTDYRKYPVDISKTDESPPMRTDHTLMDVLLGADSQKESGGLNPRGTVFFTDRAAKSLGGGKYRKGVTLDTDGGGELWDPWGEHYYVVMDLDNNSRVEKPSWDASELQVLPESILIWSAGRDLSESEAKDNIKTW